MGTRDSIGMRNLVAFLRELLGSSSRRRIIMLDTSGIKERPFTIETRLLRRLVVALAATLGLILVVVLMLSPVRTLIPGYGTAELREEAILATHRLAALEDSVAAQLEQMERLRRVLTGQAGSTDAPPMTRSGGGLAPDGTNGVDPWAPGGTLASEQPAIYWERLQVYPPPVATELPHRSPGLVLPAVTPVWGYATQPFDASAKHFGIDIATKEGRIVRSIGAGVVVFADWAYGGGHTIALQHAGGYVTVFKHNLRLLKDVGDRVTAREGIAISGDTGQRSTGPHLHFELWNHGVAQDPHYFLIGL